jgi:hypothetical protein
LLVVAGCRGQAPVSGPARIGGAGTPKEAIERFIGSAKAQDVIDTSREAARVVRTSAPQDPSLLVVRQYVPAMFVEFGRAVRARAAGRNAAPAMYRSYSIRSHVDEILRAAQPGLAAQGCTVADLF